MKLRNIVASFLAVVAMSVSCVDELSGDLGSIKLDKSTIVMPEQGGSATITINAMTDWSVDAATVPEGVTVTPMSGKAGETKMTISTNGGSLNDIASDIVILVGKQKQFIRWWRRLQQKRWRRTQINNGLKTNENEKDNSYHIRNACSDGC